MNFLVIDLEMSGLDPLYNEIIQIGACLYNEKWEQLGSYSQNVYPENEKGI
jgi:DNA polymerase III subunit epsilon